MHGQGWDRRNHYILPPLPLKFSPLYPPETGGYAFSQEDHGITRKVGECSLTLSVIDAAAINFILIMYRVQGCRGEI